MARDLHPLRFQQQCTGVLDEFFDADEELDGFASVHDAVVVGEREIHHGSDDNLTFAGDGTVLNVVEPEDADLRGIEDGRAEHGAIDATVADGEGATAEIIQREGAVLRFFGHGADGALELGERETVSIADDGDNKSFGRADGNANVEVVFEDDFVTLNFAVELRKRFERADGRFDEKGGDAKPNPVTLFERFFVRGAAVHDRAHVHFVKGGEHGGGLLCLDEAAGDGLAAARHFDAFFRGERRGMRSVGRLVGWSVGR